jgi:hypothetical protein
MLGIGLALLASLAWGFGDFIGGSKSRVLPVLVVIVWHRYRRPSECATAGRHRRGTGRRRAGVA